MYAVGQLVNGAAGSGSKAKEVADNTERNELIGTISDGTEVIVLNATIGDDADPTVENPAKPQARYRYHKDGVPAFFEKIAEEESIDLVLYSELPDTAVTTQTYGDIPSGTTWAELKGRKLMGVVLDFIFQTVFYNYQNPSAATNVSNSNVEVGEVFSQSVVASFTRRDAGEANRVQIQINEADVQDTSSPALDYSYDDNNQVLSDGQTRRYRTIIHYDEGAVELDISGKGKPSPGNIQAGSKTSSTRTKTARRKVWYGKSTPAPTNSAAVRALPSVQWDNDYTLTITLIDGDSSIVVAVPDHLTLSNVTFNGVLPLDQTTEMLATEQIVSVEGASAGYAKNYRVYRLAPESAYTASSYSITLKAV